MSFREEIGKIPIQGIKVYYYFVCKRKLWFYSHNITQESENEDVKIGKFIHKKAYTNEKHDIPINNEINLDIIKRKRGDLIIIETKKSSKLIRASIWQVKYYLYYLKKYGVHIKEGLLTFPSSKKVIKVRISTYDETILEKILSEIKRIITQKDPPPIIKQGYCKRCAYYDLCFI